MASYSMQDNAGAVRGGLARARLALSEASQRTKELIESLPGPGQRSPQQHATVAAAHDAARDSKPIHEPSRGRGLR